MGKVIHSQLEFDMLTTEATKDEGYQVIILYHNLSEAEQLLNNFKEKYIKCIKKIINSREEIIIELKSNSVIRLMNDSEAYRKSYGKSAFWINEV